MQQQLLGNNLKAWLLAFIITIVAYYLLKTIKAVTASKIATLAARTSTRLDDLLAEMLHATKPFFLFAVAAYIAAATLTVSPQASRVLGAVVTIAIFLQVGIWGNGGIAFWIEHYMKKRAAIDSATATTIGLLTFLARMIFYVVLVLLALNNLGVNITALVAGLGVGGIAIALALQNILGDLFASLTIVLDRPFIVGDFVSVDDLSGTIEHIGLKTTRIRSISGEQLVFSNTDLLKSRIRNYQSLQERRVVFSLGVPYETPSEQVRKIPSLVEKCVSLHADARFDRCHFASLGESALNFETVYFVTTPDYLRYMDIQQAINLDVMAAFEREKIGFAYPTRTILVRNS